MSKPGKAEGTGATQEATILVSLLLLGALAWVVWEYYRAVIVLPVLGMDWLQYRALHALGLLDRVGERWLAWVEAVFRLGRGPADPARVEWVTLTAVQADIGGRMRYPLAFAAFGLAALTLFKMKGDGLRRQYSLTGRSYEEVFRLCGIKIEGKLAKRLVKLLLRLTFTTGLLSTERKEWVNKGASFAHYQASHWKVTLVGANFDPDRNDPRERPQLSPMEWLRENGVRLTKKEGLDEEAAALAFERQLGPAWHGVETAPYHVQAICVLAALNLKRDKRVGALRERLTEIHVLQPARAEPLTREAIAPFLKDPKILAALNKRGARHAFLNTAAMGIYGWGGPMREWGGGEAGVLSTSMFRWLKPVDRTLWYALNNVGRRAYHIEGAGVVSHFQAERVSGQAIAAPYMDSAVEGLVRYLEEQAIDDLETFFHKEQYF